MEIIEKMIYVDHPQLKANIERVYPDYKNLKVTKSNCRVKNGYATKIMSLGVIEYMMIHDKPEIVEFYTFKHLIDQKYHNDHQQ